MKMKKIGRRNESCKKNMRKGITIQKETKININE